MSFCRSLCVSVPLSRLCRPCLCVPVSPPLGCRRQSSVSLCLYGGVPLAALVFQSPPAWLDQSRPGAAGPAPGPSDAPRAGDGTSTVTGTRAPAARPTWGSSGGPFARPVSTGLPGPGCGRRTAPCPPDRRRRDGSGRVGGGGGRLGAGPSLYHHLGGDGGGGGVRGGWGSQYTPGAEPSAAPRPVSGSHGPGAGRPVAVKQPRRTPAVEASTPAPGMGWDRGRPRPPTPLQRISGGRPGV